MRKSLLLLLCCLSVALSCVAQDSASSIQALKSSYSASGSIVALDSQTILIEPKMPAPLCAVPRNEAGKISWSYYAFPLASITVPLTAIDETLITEDTVFTNPDAAKSYKPGDVGDTTMVVIAGISGRQFHTITYDRDKLAQLGPGPHSSKEYGQAPDDTEAFGLTFPDRASARAFEMALRDAVLRAKARASRQ
jgi:hypothetical protein